MSPRKTRRGAKSEDLSGSVSDMVSKKLSPEKQKRMKTRRQLRETIILDSDEDQSSEFTSSKNKAIEETPSGKVRRKKAAVDNSINMSNSTLDVTTTTTTTRRRTRRGKETDNKTELATLNENNEAEKVSSKMLRLKSIATVASPATPKSVKRRGRNAKLRAEDFTPESSPITVNLTPHRTTKTPRKSPMNLGSPKSHADTSLRLSKTPRKLPIVSESPVPSETSVKSSNQEIPEKNENDLIVIKQELSDISIKKKKHRSSKSKSKSPEKSLFVPLGKFSKTPKIVLRTPKAKSTKKSSRVIASKAKKTPIQKRSSKSPKTKSRSPSPKKSNASRSPRKSPEISFDDNKSLIVPVSRMSLHLRRIDSPNSTINLSPVSKNIAQAFTIPPKVVIQSPTVVLDMLPPFTNVTPETTSSYQRKTPITSSSSEKRSSMGGESPRKSKSSQKSRSSTSDSGTPLRPMTSPRDNISTGKQSEGKSIILSSSNNTPVVIVERKIGSGAIGPMISSTPRERIRRSLNLSPYLPTTPSVVNVPTNDEPPVPSPRLISEGRTRRNFRIEDESNPLITDDESSTTSGNASGTQLNGTYEIGKQVTEIVEKEEEKLNDGTYELLEPKTPNLRRKSVKRGLDEDDTSIYEKSAAKRACRVRFASPPLNSTENKALGNDIGRSRTATPGHQVKQKETRKKLVNGHDDSTIGTHNTTQNNTSSLNNSRKRSNSIANISRLKTPESNIKRRSNSLSNVNARLIAKKAQDLSVSRLSKPRLSIPSTKKSDVKTPSARKAPNFALMHEKKFAKMESLVDVKKRVEKRHLALTTQIPSKLPKAINNTAPPKSTVSPKVTPSVAVTGAYNRYGFKLRKNEAMNMISNKNPPKSGTTQSENRLYLKGVRTNRRFDLIMKARNINH